MALVRKALEAQLKPLLPRTWRIVPYQRNLDTIAHTTVMFKQTAIDKLPQAPQGVLIVDLTLTIISHFTDTVKAEDDLDDAVLELCLAMDANPHVIYGRADKVMFDDTHLAYDITIQTTARKD